MSGLLIVYTKGDCLKLNERISVDYERMRIDLCVFSRMSMCSSFQIIGEVSL